MVVLVIDARSRERNVFAASATQVADDPIIVLRRAADAGAVKNLHGRTVETPILVVGDYEARSSAGFVTQIGEMNFPRYIWVGGTGFGRDGRGDGLRPFGWPLPVTLLPAKCRVEAVVTHGNSNPETAEAALLGLRMQAEADPNLLLLTEGQSDTVAATAFRAPEGWAPPELPQEHRPEIFSSERILDAAERRMKAGGGVSPCLRAVFLKTALEAYGLL